MRIMPVQMMNVKQTNFQGIREDRLNIARGMVMGLALGAGVMSIPMEDYKSKADTFQKQNFELIDERNALRERNEMLENDFETVKNTMYSRDNYISFETNEEGEWQE